MSFEDYTPLEYERMGGLVTWPPDADVPVGSATDLLNVRFRPGAYLTRPGMVPPGAGFDYSGGGAIGFNGITQFIDNAGSRQLLALDSNGAIRRHDGVNWNTTIQDHMASGSGFTAKQSFWRTVQMFNRIFIATYRNETNAVIQPGGVVRDYDGTNLDVLAPDGPGRGPCAVNSATAGTIGVGRHQVAVMFETRGGRYLTEPSPLYWAPILIAAAPAGAVRAANVVTISTAVHDHGLIVGQTVLIEGVTDTSFNGTFVVATVPGVSQFTYAQVAANATSGGGQLRGACEFTAAGNFKVDLTSIPTGPSWVQARRLIFTAGGGSDFFYLERFRIGDNTTTTLTVDFDETTLQGAGENYNKYFRNLRLPDFSGIASYGAHLVCWGGINTVKMLNLNFNGGFTGGIPHGWSPDAAGVAGGSVGTTTPYAGPYYVITGNGVTAVRGAIGHVDATTLVKANTAYRISARVRKGSGHFTGEVNIDLFGTGVDTTGLVLTSLQTTTDWTEYEAELTSGLTAIPTDLRLRVFVGSTLGNGNEYHIARIQIWPSDTKWEASTLRITDPNDIRFDGLTGLSQIAKDDGQRILACIEQNGYLYVQKERSGHVLREDSQNTPNQWAQERISTSVGGCSPNGVDGTESYYVVAARQGAFLVQGQTLTKLSQEIQTTWDRINWEGSHLIHVLIDPEKKVVYFFVPLDAIQSAKFCIGLDFSEGWGGEHDPGGRKWFIDSYPYPILSSTRIETATRRQDLYFGSANATVTAAQVHRFDSAIKADGVNSDVAIQNYYESAYRKARGNFAGQDLFAGLAVSASGSGNLAGTLKGFDGRNYTLPVKALAAQQVEIPLIGNLESDRAKWRLETNAVGHWQQVSRVVMYATEWATSKPM